MIVTAAVAALLRAVLENPEDDTVRLVYADALDETDDYAAAERAGMIRAMIAARPGDREVRTHMGSALGWAHYYDSARYGYNEVVDRCWRAPGFGPTVECPAAVRICDTGGYPGTRPYVLWERGFVSAVGLDAGTYDADAGGWIEELFSTHPVTRIDLVDRTPGEARASPRVNFKGASWDWWGYRRTRPPAGTADRLPGTDFVPPLVFTELADVYHIGPVRSDLTFVEFPSRAGAVAALRFACVARGRRAAGLPQFDPPSPPEDRP